MEPGRHKTPMGMYTIMFITLPYFTVFLDRAYAIMAVIATAPSVPATVTIIDIL